jgi:hypothetical protein
MKTRTAIGLVIAFTAGITLVPMSAKAVCQQTIYADNALTDGTNTQILGRVNSTDNFAYSATTTIPVFAQVIFAAVSHRNTVIVVGNAATCPTTGDVRNMGAILVFNQNP